MTVETRSLRDRVNRIAYVVINVSDLERSRDFYEDVTPLRTMLDFKAAQQPFRGLGIESGSFSACAMTDSSGPGATEIHLVQWLDPASHGEPYPVFWHVGLAKIAFLQESAKDTLEQLSAKRIRPVNQFIYRNYVSIQDPDGVMISFPHLGYERRGEPFPGRLIHVNPSVTDVDQGWKFYGEFLGLELGSEHRPREIVDSSQGPGSQRSRWDSHMMSSRGDRRFHVDYSQFRFPLPSPETSTPYRSASQIGIARIGIEVDDLDRCLDITRAAIEHGVDVEIVHEPEEWNLGAYGVKRVLCLLDPDGIRVELVEKRPSTRRPTFNDTPVTEPIAAW